MSSYVRRMSCDDWVDRYFVVVYTMDTEQTTHQLLSIAVFSNVYTRATMIWLRNQRPMLFMLLNLIITQFPKSAGSQGSLIHKWRFLSFYRHISGYKSRRLSVRKQPFSLLEDTDSNGAARGMLNIITCTISAVVFIISAMQGRTNVGTRNFVIIFKGVLI